MTLTLARQIGRWWAGAASLTFVEPADAAPGHVYACPLPEPAHREPTAASIAVVASAGPTDIADTDPTRRVVMAIEAHADTLDDAMVMLDALRDLVREDDKPFRSPRTRGVIGLPPDAEFVGSEPVRGWRVLGFEVVSEPQPLRFAPGDQTPGGQSSAQMTIGVVAHRVSLLRAFDVTNTTGGLSAATIEIDPVSVILNTTMDGGVGDATIDRRGLSVADLAAAIAGVSGGGWETSNLGAGVDGLDAMDVIGFDPADANGVTKRLVVMTSN